MPLALPATAPVAVRKAHDDTRHGVTINDPYAWLRAPDWQAVMHDPETLSPDIRRHLEAENAYTETALAPLATIRQTLFEEMRGRIREDDSTVPVRDGEWYYFRSFETGAQYPVYARSRHKDASTDKQILLDGNKEAGDSAYFHIGGLAHSPDHRYLAWAEDRKGSEFFTLHIRDLETGKNLADTLPDTSANPVWAADSRTLFYTRLDENHRPSRVFRHTAGTSAREDVLVYEEDDPGFYVTLGQSQDSHFILIEIHDHQTSEVWLVPATAPETPPVCVEPRREGIRYDLDHDAGRFVILTNDDAEDFRIVQTPVSTPGAAHWKPFISHQPGTLILEHMLLKNHLIRLERRDGLKHIVLHNLSTQEERIITFDEEAYDLNLMPGYEYQTTTVRFQYASMTTPARIFDYDAATHTRKLRKEQEIPGGHKPAHYATRRLFATAPDGTKIPVSLLYHKDTPIDGTAPLLLYGYGAYGISMDAAFSITALSLVDRGFIYAIAHIRGGKEGGYRWYAQGKRDKKKNTFLDFVACARHLIAENITAHGHITAHGGSAGGMLVGAVANMNPDIFRAIIAEVPFVDVLNTMLDASLPLTPPEWLEWGNPLEDREAFEYIASYSPYDNITAQDYPAILALAGLTDPRVTYWEPAKWVARLRATKTDTRPLLLKTHMEAGHAGASGRFNRLEEVALVQAFILAVYGLA